jgi:hypothetical protein
MVNDILKLAMTTVKTEVQKYTSRHYCTLYFLALSLYESLYCICTMELLYQPLYIESLTLGKAKYLFFKASDL